MGTASYIFWAIFVVPLIVFLGWVMKQDKRKGKIGLVVLLVIIVGVIVYMYFRHMFEPYTETGYQGK